MAIAEDKRRRFSTTGGSVFSLLLAFASLAGLLGCRGSTGAKLDASSATTATITVDTTQEQEAIEGFGGFGPAKVWWDSPPFFDQTWLDKLDDLGVTIVRTSIEYDFESADGTFHLAPTSANGQQLDYLKALQSRGIKILATAWTPPVWMKLNPDNSLASFCNGQCGGTLDPEHYQDYADYLVEYVKDMHAAGVEIYALDFANEPLYAAPYESCVYTAQSYADVLKLVSAAFAQAGLSTKLFGPEWLGIVAMNTQFFASILGDATAANALGFYAVHMYTFTGAPDYGSSDNWTQLYQQVSAAGKELWMTETVGPKPEQWDEAFLMAKSLGRALRFGKISAWVYWYLAENVLTTAPDNTPYPIYYALKQYFRYIRPGYVQVASATDDADILPNAFTFGDGLTVVLVNDGSLEKAVMVEFASGLSPTFDGYRTSSTENAVSIGKVDATSVRLPARSITTLHVAPTPDTISDDGGSQSDIACEGNGMGSVASSIVDTGQARR